MTDNKSKDGAELTDEEKAKAAAEEGLSEDELDGVSGGAGAVAARPQVAGAGVAVKHAVGTAIPGAAGVGGAGSYHIKTGPVFPKGNNSMPGGNQQQGG